MALTAAQLSALKVELTTDPRGYGYATNWNAGFDGGIPPIINLVRDGSTGTVPTNPTGGTPAGQASGIIRLPLLSVDTGMIRATVTQGAFTGLVTATQQYFQWLVGNGALLVNAGLLQSLAGIPTANSAIWAAGDRTAMNAAMEALLRRNCSRAEELFGIGVGVTTTDVTNCRTAA